MKQWCPLYVFLYILLNPIKNRLKIVPKGRVAIHHHLSGSSLSLNRQNTITQINDEMHCDHKNKVTPKFLYKELHFKNIHAEDLSIKMPYLHC